MMILQRRSTVLVMLGDIVFLNSVYMAWYSSRYLSLACCSDGSPTDSKHVSIYADGNPSLIAGHPSRSVICRRTL